MSDEQHRLHREKLAAIDVLRAIRSEIEATADEADAEADQAALRENMIEGETNLLEAIDAALARVVLIDGHLEGLQKTVERLLARAERFDRQRERIRDAILRAMAETGLGKQERALATVSLTRRPKEMRITAEHDVPEDFWRVPEAVLDKNKLKEALKGGASIPGAIWADPEKPHAINIRFR